jgi:hypothetical protein
VNIPLRPSLPYSQITVERCATDWKVNSYPGDDNQN